MCINMRMPGPDPDLKDIILFVLLVIRPMGLGLRLNYLAASHRVWAFHSDSYSDQFSAFGIFRVISAIAQTDKRKWFCAVVCECVHQHADARTRPRPQGSQSVSLLVRSWPIRPKAQIQCHSVAQHESRIVWGAESLFGASTHVCVEMLGWKYER